MYTSTKAASVFGYRMFFVQDQTTLSHIKLCRLQQSVVTSCFRIPLGVDDIN